MTPHRMRRSQRCRNRWKSGKRERAVVSRARDRVPELLELKSSRCERGIETSRLANRSLRDRLQLFVLTKEASMTITIYDAAYAPTAARAALDLADLTLFNPQKERYP